MFSSKTIWIELVVVNTKQTGLTGARQYTVQGYPEEKNPIIIFFL